MFFIQIKFAYYSFAPFLSSVFKYFKYIIIFEIYENIMITKNIIVKDHARALQQFQQLIMLK